MTSCRKDETNTPILRYLGVKHMRLWRIVFELADDTHNRRILEQLDALTGSHGDDANSNVSAREMARYQIAINDHFQKLIQEAKEVTSRRLRERSAITETAGEACSTRKTNTGLRMQAEFHLEQAWKAKNKAKEMVAKSNRAVDQLAAAKADFEKKWNETKSQLAAESTACHDARNEQIGLEKKVKTLENKLKRPITTWKRGIRGYPS